MPISATALELKHFTHLDDAGLRRLSNENSTNPATGRPWIPKPVKGIYDTAPTLAGVAAWWHHQATRESTDHPTYADMEEAETRGLVPREFQKYAKAKGVEFINLNRSIKIEPLRRLAADVLRKLFANASEDFLEQIDGGEYINPDVELAKLRREQRRDVARKNATEEGRVHSRERIEDLLWENAVAPLRVALLNLRKTAFSLIENELDKAEVPAKSRAAVKNILAEAVDQLLQRIRQAFPTRD